MGNTNLPIGFIMSVAQNKDALKYYSNLDDATKSKISDYIQGSTTGDEAKIRINTSVEGLTNHNLHFLN
jgi:abortive infection bacteriophage resistance protein